MSRVVVSSLIAAMSQPWPAAAAASPHYFSTTPPLYPPQPPLTASSKHSFPSYDSLRLFLEQYAHPRGFEVRWETKGSAYSAAHGGKAVCWCSRPNPDHKQAQPLPPSTSDASAAPALPEAAVADDSEIGGVAVSRKRRRRKVTCDAEQVLCGCRWFVNFNRRGEGEHAVYTITARHLAHNGDQWTQHDERPFISPPSPPQPMDEASALQQRLAGAVEAAVRGVLSSKAEYGIVAVDEQALKRAVQLDRKRDGRLVCYAAKQCAAAINRQQLQQQQQQHEGEHKDGSAMTDISTSTPAVVSAEEMADAMAAAIRTQVALDEQLAAAVEVSATEGFINLTLHVAPTLPLVTSSTSPHPSSIVSFPSFPLPASPSSPAAAAPLPPSYLFPSIGTFHSIYNEKYGTPRQGSVTPHSRGRLVLHPHVDPQSLEGLAAYSHVWLLFVFHLNTNTAVRAKVRPPRLGAKVGVFATRSPHRPSPIGMTVARVVRVELDKRTVHVSGVDVVDGTPVVDIKPYHPADCVAAATVPQWVNDGSGSGQGLEVRVQPHVRAEVRRWAAEGRLAMYDDGDEALAAVVECISGDPRTLNAKRKHQHTYGGTAAHKAEERAVEEKEERVTRKEEEVEEDEVVEAEEMESEGAAAATASAGDVIYGVSVDRVDVAFRMLYQVEAVHPAEDVEEGRNGAAGEEKDVEKSGGESKKRRRKEMAEVFHCELYEAGQPRPKMRTKEWFVRMRRVLAQQQQQQSAAAASDT